jgi:hypothetical protein
MSSHSGGIYPFLRMSNPRHDYKYGGFCFTACIDISVDKDEACGYKINSLKILKK